MKQPALPEFIALMAVMAALVAFSIDSMLPALPAIAHELVPENINRAQLVLGVFIIALGMGTLFAGPLSDRFGRRPVLVLGVVIYAIGALLAWAAPTLEALLAARFLQGVGCAGPRVVTMAITRDRFSGAKMARIMSYVMIVFSLVPALAPLLGAQITNTFGWRAIFLAFIGFSFLMGMWFFLRQPETLMADKRAALSFPALSAAVKEILGHPTTRLTIIILALGFAMLFSTLSSVQQVFDITYGNGPEFPYYFGVIALLATSSGFINARFVERLGMRAMIKGMLLLQVGLSSVMLLSTFIVSDPSLSFAIYIIWVFSMFFQAGLMFGNLNALALEPMGHIAGLAASIITSFSTIGAMIIAIPLAMSFDGTARPIAMGVLVCAILALYLTTRIKRPGEF